MAEAPYAALSEPGEGGALGDEVGGGALVGDGEQQAARREQGREGDDEGGHRGTGDQEAVEQTDRTADQERYEQRGQDAPLRGPGGEHTAEGEDGADGQVDPAGDDDQGHAEGDHGEERRLHGHAAGVVQGGERRVDERRGDHDGQQDGQDALAPEEFEEPPCGRGPVPGSPVRCAVSVRRGAPAGRRDLGHGHGCGFVHRDLRSRAT